MNKNRLKKCNAERNICAIGPQHDLAVNKILLYLRLICTIWIC